METYNKYIIHPHKAEIAIVNAPSTAKQIFYVVFKDGKQGYYLDKENGYLRGLERKKTLSTAKFNEEFIKDIKSVFRNYCFIKVIKDEKNTQLEGETMVFYFGKQVKDILQRDASLVLQKTFMLVTKLKGYFSTFEDSYFTINDFKCKENLDIEQYINFPILDLEKMIKQKQRKEKLEYLQKQTQLKDNIITILEQQMNNEIKTEEIINLIAEI